MPSCCSDHTGHPYGFKKRKAIAAAAAIAAITEEWNVKDRPYPNNFYKGTVLPAIEGSQWLSCIEQGHPASLSLNMVSTVQIPGLCYYRGFTVVIMYSTRGSQPVLLECSLPAIEGSQWLSCIVHGAASECY